MNAISFQTNQITAPVWAGDFGNREHLLPGGVKLDAAQFRKTDAVVVVVGPAGAAIDATSVPVDALSGALPSGTLLDFGGKKFARLTAGAAANATSIAVSALATAVVDNDTAIYAGSANAKATVLSGTPIGRTYSERTAGTAFGPADAADDEIFLVWADITDVTVDPRANVYRPGGVVKENFLPGFANIASGVLTKIRALYQTTRGAA